MNLTVAPLENAGDRRAFLHLPHRLYAGDPNWVAPLFTDMKEKLDPHRHPFYADGEVRFFLARREGRPVGRVAALVDEAHNRFHGEKTAAFGLFESERDGEVVHALIRAAAAFGRERGMERLRGPVSFSTNEECGTLVDGFEHLPAVMMTYNPAWHATLLEYLGLKKGRDLLAYTIVRSPALERISRVSRKAAKRNGLRARCLRLKAFDRELESIRALYNETWEKSWGFVPMDRKTFDWQAGKLKPVLEPRLALIVEKGDTPVGFSLSLPDYSPALQKMNGRLFPLGLLRFLLHRKKLDGLRVMTMGILPDFRNQGAEGLLIQHTIDNGEALGFRRAELSWVLEDNEAMNRLAEKIGARVYKRYRLYDTPLEELP